MVFFPQGLFLCLLIPCIQTDDSKMSLIISSSHLITLYEHLLLLHKIRLTSMIWYLPASFLITKKFPVCPSLPR